MQEKDPTFAEALLACAIWSEKSGASWDRAHDAAIYTIREAPSHIRRALALEAGEKKQKPVDPWNVYGGDAVYWNKEFITASSRAEAAESRAAAAEARLAKLDKREVLGALAESEHMSRCRANEVEALKAKLAAVIAAAKGE